jgi:hypothetical protein
MTTREKLIKEIEETPEDLLKNLLNFLLFVKDRYEVEITPEEKAGIIESKKAFDQGNYLTLEEYLADQT